MKSFLLGIVFFLAISFPVFSQPVQAPGFFGATPVTASATGTTAITTATIPAVAGKTAHLCGFSIRANATAAKTGPATVVGLRSGTLSFSQFTAPLASDIGTIEPPFGGTCIPASAPNVAIVINSDAPGAGGVVTVAAWGFYF